MAPGITSEEFGGKLKVFDTGKKLYIITETPWYFWLTTIFFVLALVSIPYLLFLMYDYYEKIPEANKTEEDKKYFNGGIAMTVVLSITIIAVIVGFIVTESRKNGGKLDREQLEDYGKSLIVKGAAVRTADLINANGGSIIDDASNQIAKTVVNQQGSDYINKTSEEKVGQLSQQLVQNKINITGTGLTKKEQAVQEQAAQRERAQEDAEAARQAAEAGIPNVSQLQLVGGSNKLGSPVSLSRSYKRRKSPSSLKKKKASPKKKSTSSRRK